MNPAADSEQRSRVAEFQRKHRVGLLTLLFTDMAGSTQLKQDLGDRQAVMLIQHHHAIVREILEGFNEGLEISTAGDSFFIVFAKPSDAAKFSLLLQSRLRELRQQYPRFVSDRIGIHVGEVFVENCENSRKAVDLYGIQVDTAARVMSLAQGEQILMTRFAFDNARQVLRGEPVSGLGKLSWLNHGFYQMKGVEEPIEICEVGEEGLAPLAPPPDSEKGARHLSSGGETVFIYRSGDQALTLEEWFAQARDNPIEARKQLYSTQFEQWLRYNGWSAWAESAARLRSTQPDPEKGLQEFTRQWTDHRMGRALEKLFHSETEVFKAKSRAYRGQLFRRAILMALLGASAGWFAQQYLDVEQMLGVSLGVIHPSPWQYASPLAGYVGAAVLLLTGCLACLRQWWRWRPYWKARGIHNLKNAYSKAPEATREFVRFRRKENRRTFLPVFVLAVLLAPFGVVSNHYYGVKWKAQLDRARLSLKPSSAFKYESTNSLGMVFARIPSLNNVQVCIWETRRKDFADYLQASGHNAATNNVSTTGDMNLPVTNVSWDDAREFCRWLTVKERAEGRCGANSEYRLPTDREWSVAVGLPAEEGDTPADLSGKIANEFPWGKTWPPPLGTGNFLDVYGLTANSVIKSIVKSQLEMLSQDWPQVASPKATSRKAKAIKLQIPEAREPIPDYVDGYALLAPVGSFAPNRFGLYDLEGNASEWCENWFDTEETKRVVRGGNALEGKASKLLSSYRDAKDPKKNDDTLGFRIVLENL